MTAASEEEGVIKFRYQHDDSPLSAQDLGDAFTSLAAWRSVLYDLRLIGCEPARYGGAGFGNLSLRRGSKAFVITGSQTGHLPVPGREAYCLVEEISVDANRARSRGLSLPSSESLTHAAFYEISETISAVFHVHSPELWNCEALALPSSDGSIAYGTPQMARSVASMFADGPLRERGLMRMGGHEDGIISFGSTPEEAGLRLVLALARSRA